MTTLEDILVAYYEKRTQHTLLTLFRAARSTHNDATRYYVGDHGEQLMLARKRFEVLANEWKNSLKTATYLDAHAWYFTLDSFRCLLTALVQLDFFLVLRIM